MNQGNSNPTTKLNSWWTPIRRGVGDSSSNPNRNSKPFGKPRNSNSKPKPGRKPQNGGRNLGKTLSQRETAGLTNQNRHWNSRSSSSWKAKPKPNAMPNSKSNFGPNLRKSSYGPHKTPNKGRIQNPISGNRVSKFDGNPGGQFKSGSGFPGVQSPRLKTFGSKGELARGRNSFSMNSRIGGIPRGAPAKAKPFKSNPAGLAGKKSLFESQAPLSGAQKSGGNYKTNFKRSIDSKSKSRGFPKSNPQNQKATRKQEKLRKNTGKTCAI
jgi:hypothetical protein